MNNLLQQGIVAAKAGEKAQAYQLLTRATQDIFTAGQAWIWLSGVVEHDSERLFCLENALRVDPNHAAARRGVSLLRQQGIIPAPPFPPFSQASDGMKAPAPIDQSGSAPQPDTVNKEGLQESRDPIAILPAAPSSAIAGERSDQETKVVYQFVAQELARNTPPALVVKELVDRSVPQETARQIVAGTQKALKGARAEKFRKRMVRGLLWTIAGALITCLTYVFASDLGGSYILCYGAILFGIIDFLVGLVGWLSNR